MTMKQRWTAKCDAPGCDVEVILERIPGGEKWDYGEALNDLGWQAAPGWPDTYCPRHWHQEGR